MNEEKTSKIRIILTIITVIILLGIAYFYIFGFPGLKIDSNQNKDSQETNLKINPDKEYIYFQNVTPISEELELYYKDPIINLKSDDAKNINEKYETLVSKNRGSETKTTNEEEKLVCFDEIATAKIIDFDSYEFKNYITLTALSYDYICPSSNNVINPAAYTFDTKTGKLLTMDEILQIYNLNSKDLRNKIAEKLKISSEKLTAENNELVNFIHIDETLNSLKYNETFNLYINSEGKLMVNCIVITDNLKYNEDIEIA